MGNNGQPHMLTVRERGKNLSENTWYPLAQLHQERCYLIQIQRQVVTTETVACVTSVAYCFRDYFEFGEEGKHATSIQ